ncbi:MAG: BMP family ABC transporter substrate-binding protein [Ruminococcaceae bacterium]|jgi:basic membrane protein A|nr:BMP family ABC transporter substrate-binding protein [Oscillospiraceae bacterium]
MKKVLALGLALVLVLSLAACGGKKAEAEANPQPKVTDNADEVSDNMTSSDGKYEVAFVTDVGQLKDKSFNQGTYDGVKLYANNNGLSYKYYQPANGDQATDDDRYDAMKSACENGAKVVVAAGFMQGSALERAAKDYPDTKFVFIDGWGMGLDNVVGIAFNEHECGYLAGYAVVKEGYEKLGFCGGGGGNNPACCRYGYGFVQGANAAAAEMGKQIDINYTWLYGASFSASPEMQTLANGWYETGTEVIFSAGGSIFQSITAAAAANDKFVVGVDTDQSYESDTVITSALKGVKEAASWAIGKAYDGTWASLNGFVSLGAADGATGLPEATWSLKNYSVDEYKAQLADIVSGKLQISSDVLENDAILSVNFSNATVNYVA